MAFYTSKVDENGVEIERRSSARSFSSSAESGTFNTSSRSSGIMSGIRYVNSAAYIEKSSDEMSVSTGVDGPGYISEHNSLSDVQSDIVPPLDIQSEDNYQPPDYTFSYRKHCEAAKLVIKPDLAYETWLSAKRKILSDEAAKRKEAEEQKRKQMEERKRLAEEKFQSWLQSKARLQKSTSKSTSPQLSNQTSKNTLSESGEKPSRSPISEAEAQARIDDWNRRKRSQEERRRAMKKEEEEKRQKIEEQRREMAAEAWEKWIAEAPKKPKPVPLNRGIFTLRGTISSIYINPNEWQSILPVKEDD